MMSDESENRRLTRKEKRFEDFQCKRCGRCCTGDGYVNLTVPECERIAKYLDLPLEEFLEDYTIQDVGFERYLVDADGDDMPCIFLERDAKGLSSCRIQGPAKPEQCKTFPMKWRDAGFQKWCAAFGGKSKKELDEE